MKQKLLKTMRGLLVAAGLCVGVNAWAQVTTTLMEYGTNDVAWTAEGLATWTSSVTATLANDASYVQYTGTNNGDFSTYKTISPTSGNIINVTAVWRARSNTGRGWSENGGIYFRFGNIVVAQNDQDQKHGYVFTGLSNISSVTTFTAGSYRTDIASLPWLKIEMEINTKTNTLTSFSVKSEDGTTTYASASKIALTNADYTTVAFGFQRGGRHTTEKQEQLKSIKITETTPTTQYADYTVHFVDKNGDQVKADVTRSGEVGTTVNANTDDIATYYNGGFKYVYDNDGGGVEVTSDGSAKLTITYTKYGQYTYTVNAVDESSNPLTTLATATIYEGETQVLKWSKYINVGDQWYITSENSFTQTATEAGSKNVVYNKSDIAYFFEMENLTRSGGAYLTEEDASYSNNARLRLSRGSTYYTPALAGGIYHLSIGCANSNNSSNEVYVYTRSANGTLSDKLHTHTATNGTTTLSYVITVPDGYSIAFNGNEGGSANNNARMDYMTLTQVTVPVSVTAGKEFATFNSDYALDFTNVTDIIAYTAKMSTDGSSVMLTKVTGAVPANTGLLIRKAGESTSANVPAVATAAAVDNDFIAVTATNCDDSQDYKTVKEGFILATVSGKQGFYKANSTDGTQVAKGKAYLPATGYTARLTMNFDDEANGISDMRMTTIDNAVYNLNGVQVSQPTKGLYIVNGKKVIIK